MATLRGKNFRILVLDETSGKFKVVGMSTSCTVNLVNNAEEANHKDIPGIASNPEITSRTWNAQVESLDVSDVAAIIRNIKESKLFTLVWDETSTTNNQRSIGVTFGRRGMAYINDATFQFDNRTNSTKSLQFTGAAPLESLSGAVDQDIIPIGSVTKGQYVRLMLGLLSSDSKLPVASARSLQLHLSVQLEDATTKDTEGDFQVQEPVGYSYDISSTALMRSGETITSEVGAQTLTDVMAMAGWPGVRWEIANMGGANQRTKLSTICSGRAAVTNLTLNGPLETADYTVQLNGQGDIEVAA